ncbi:hypothetical protein [Prosthecobacter sp.]|uniref:hypothetical protein n=1 Tax=Prosthecobacter sp. TaxID=1965333 RepID=UPI0037847E2E
MKRWRKAHRDGNMCAMEDLNPYAAPTAKVLVTDADASRVRYDHLRTESHLKALGWVLLMLGILSLFFSWMIQRIQWREFGLEPGLEVIPWYDWVTIGMYFVAGLGLIRLMKLAGLLTMILSAVWLITNALSLPQSLVGITIHAFILRFLFQKQTRFIFSESYQTTLRQTPEIKSRMESWGILVIILLLLILIIPAWIEFH